MKKMDKTSSRIASFDAELKRRVQNDKIIAFP
jgi:hypothetical protein